MAQYKKAEAKQVIMGRLDYGSDLVEALTEVCLDNDIRLGRVEAIGAVQKACVGYYNQQTRSYEYHNIDQPVEITNLTGNISLKEGKPFVHAHITLTDSEGNASGGHLCPGTTVFACEFIIQAFDGPEFNRSHDAQTALPLWSM